MKRFEFLGSYNVIVVVMIGMGNCIMLLLMGKTHAEATHNHESTAEK